MSCEQCRKYEDWFYEVAKSGVIDSYIQSAPEFIEWIKNLKKEAGRDE